jgi:hypothetical protein
MSSELGTMAEEAAKLVTQVEGAGARFEEACRRAAARDLRGTRKAEAEDFFDVARKVVETARASNEPSGDRQHREVLVFLVKASSKGGPLHVEAMAEALEPKHMREVMEKKEAYALPEEMFWDFSEWFKDGISSGSFDAKGAPGGRVSELVYSEFKGASRSWLERKGWDNLVKALEGTP